MTGYMVHLQPGFILQQRPYRETSVLLDVFTRDFGVITLLAKGVRKEKSKTAGLLLPFALLQLSYVDKNELKLLNQVEFQDVYALERLALYCGFYVNELLQKFLHKHDPHPELFIEYQRCLQHLLDGHAIEQSLRYFELSLLEAAGYGVELDGDALTNAKVKQQAMYEFVPYNGMIEGEQGLVSGHTLRQLANRAPLIDNALQESKRLLRVMLEVHLQGRPLKSRDVLASMIRYL